jgi:hypothetical protein
MFFVLFVKKGATEMWLFFFVFICIIKKCYLCLYQINNLYYEKKTNKELLGL